MASGKNTVIRSVRPASLFEEVQPLLTTTLSISQGDHVVLDTSLNVLKIPVTESSDSANYLGIMRETIVNGKLVRPYTTDVDASQAISACPGPQYGNTFSMQLKPSDALVPGSLVYMWLPGSTVSTRGVSVSGTNAIGVYQGPAVTGGPSSTGLTEVECLIGHRYPANVLQF